MPGAEESAGSPADVEQARSLLERVRLADYAGRPVVVNVWAPGCPGCNQEEPGLKRFADAHPAALGRLPLGRA